MSALVNQMNPFATFPAGREKVSIAVQTPPIAFSDTSNSATDESDNESHSASSLSPSSLGPAEVDEILETAETVARDTVETALGIAPRTPPNNSCKTMRRLVKQVLAGHNSVYTEMVEQMNLNPTQNEAQLAFLAVSDQLFQDNRIHWGRVVALYAFLAKMTQHIAAREGLPVAQQFGNEASEALASYMAQRLGDWISQHGGWESFVERYPERQNIEDAIFRGLLVTGVSLGIVAGIIAALR